MEDLVTFSARKVQRPKAEERKRNISRKKDNESQSKKQSHSNELLENCRKGVVYLGKKEKKGRELIELGGDKSTSSKAPSRSKRGSKADVRKGATARGITKKSRGGQRH